jgi:transcriptional regulator with XRE-family HTH domain
LLQDSAGSPILEHARRIAIPQTRLDVAALYAALSTRREREGLSWRQLATVLDVPPSTFTRMAQGLRPDVDAFTSMLGWLGMEARAFTQAASEGSPAANDEDPIAFISGYLRASRNVSEAEAEAIDDILKAAYRHLRRSPNKTQD